MSVYDLDTRPPRRSRHPKDSAQRTTARPFEFLLLGLALLVLFALSYAVQLVTNEHQTDLFYRALQGDLREDYASVETVAHNAGNRRSTANRALSFGPDVVEIDVRLIDGSLRASHNSPRGLLGNIFSGAPSLSTAWNRAQRADAISLDLKQSSPAFMERVFRFLRAHEEPGTDVTITSRSTDALALAATEYPAAHRVLSVTNRSQLETLLEDPAALAFVEGVSVPWRQLDEEMVASLHAAGLTVNAWVVNDLETLNDLVAWRVDQVTTDNLALLELIALSQQAHRWALLAEQLGLGAPR